MEFVDKLIQQLRRVWATAILRLLRVHSAIIRLFRRTTRFTASFLATFLGAGAAVGFLTTVGSLPPATAEIFHLTIAGTIGGILALVLTLSIIPAQRAAEAFSVAILRLYARNAALTWIFTWLAFATFVSAYFSVSPHAGQHSVAATFLLLGMSLDAVRLFYLQTLKLLEPESATNEVGKVCRRLIDRMDRSIRRAAALYELASGDTDSAGLRAVLYSASRIGRELAGWVGQLGELTHKALARKDTTAAKAAINEIGTIAGLYAERRRDSLLVVPDFSNLLGPGETDVSNVLNPVHETILGVVKDAARTPNEAIVQHCIRVGGQLTVSLMSLRAQPERALFGSPLAGTAAAYLDLALKEAKSAKMDEALLEGTRAWNSIFSATNDATDDTIESQALESLQLIAIAGYAHSQPVITRAAIETMLRAADHQVGVSGLRSAFLLEDVLASIVRLIPLELAFEKITPISLQVFPPYSPVFENNIAQILHRIGTRTVVVDEARAWVNPFSDFLRVSETVVHHYRKLGEAANFGDTLLTKWVLKSISDCGDIHLAYLQSPPAGADVHLESVDDRLRWYIYAPTFLLTSSDGFPIRCAEDVAKWLATLGMQLMEINRFDTAIKCGDAISALARQYGESRNLQPFGLADLHEYLEILARAADALGYQPLGERFRAMMERPSVVPKNDWPEYLRARETRLRQLDERLRQQDRYPSPGDPVPVLWRILAARSGR